MESQAQRWWIKAQLGNLKGTFRLTGGRPDQKRYLGAEPEKRALLLPGGCLSLGVTRVTGVRVGAYMRAAERRSLKWTDFLAPFSAQLWTGSLCAALLLAAALAVALLARGAAGGREAGRGRRGVGPRDAWLFTAAAFCQQGQPVPGAWSGRMLCVCAHLVALVLAAAHSGALISALSAGSPRLPFASLREALEYPRARFVSTVYTSYTISATSEDYMAALSKKLKEETSAHVFPYTLLETISSACNDRLTVALVGIDTVPYLTPRTHCEVQELPSARISNHIAFGLPKDSPYTGLLSYYVRRMQRTGVLSRELRRLRPRAPPLSAAPPPQPQPGVRLSAVVPLFAALAGGALLSALLLLAERALAPSRPPTLSRRGLGPRMR